MSVTAPVRAPEATVKPECLTSKVEAALNDRQHLGQHLGLSGSINRSGKGRAGAGKKQSFALRE